MWSERASRVASPPRRACLRRCRSTRCLPLDLVLLWHQSLRSSRRRDGSCAHGAPSTGGVGWFHWVSRVSLGRETRGMSSTPIGGKRRESAECRSDVCAAQRFSGRGISDRDLTLWCSWCVRSPALSVYFGGDSAYHPEYPIIASRCGPFDVVLLPIGAYEPRWFMRTVHMNAGGSGPRLPRSGDRYIAARTTIMVPIHWGAFKLTDKPLDKPAKLLEAWHDAGLPREDLWLLRHGESRQVTIGT